MEQRFDIARGVVGFDDAISYYVFCATLQLRTPLRILMAHGLEWPKEDGAPPQIVKAQWEGIWVPSPDKKFSYLLADGKSSSDIGPVPLNGGDYLKFLIAFRKSYESEATADAKVIEIMSMQNGPHATSISAHGGITALVDKVLPRVPFMIPKIKKPVAEAMCNAGLDTIRKIVATQDSVFSEIKGCGPQTISAIRDFAANQSVGPDASRIAAL